MFALGQKRTFRNPIGMFDRLRTCRHDCARLSSAQPTEANQVLTPAPRHSDQAQESSGVTHWVCSLAFLPASGFLQGIDYLARHIALIMFGKDRVCGENAARPEPAFCYYTLPFPEQVGHDALIVHGHVSLAVGHGEAHLQIGAALYAAWFHQPADPHARPWRDMLFGEVSWRIKENNRIAESAEHQRGRNGKHTETCPDQNQSSLLTGHLVSFSLRAPGLFIMSSIRRSLSESLASALLASAAAACASRSPIGPRQQEERPSAGTWSIIFSRSALRTKMGHFFRATARFTITVWRQASALWPNTR